MSGSGDDPLTIDQAYDRALGWHRNGALAQAEVLYRRILDAVPEHADTLHMLGMLAHQCGHSESAAELMRRSLALASSATCWSNLAAALLALGRLAEAESAALTALGLNPAMLEARRNLTRCLEGQGRLAEAAECCAQMLADQGDSADLNGWLGALLVRGGKFSEALGPLNKAVALSPADTDLLFLRARSLHEVGRTQDAIQGYKEVLDQAPMHSDAALHLGLVYQDAKQLGPAETMLKWAADLAPDNPYVFYNLSRLYRLMGRISAAIRAAERAVELKSDFALAYQALGNAYHGAGEMERALEAFRRGSALAPDDYGLHHNIIACLRTDWRVEGRVFRDSYREWDLRHLGHIARLSHANTPDLERRLRIGYLSPDFRNHAVAYFLEPLLQAHDRSRFEVFCYSQVEDEDAVTRRFEALADHWRVTLKKSDDDVAAMIQADGIDILVDCAGHTIGMRMHVFARKPAPIQVSTLVGHDTTTGVAAMDYILSDPYLTPDGYDDHFTETLIRLPTVVAPFLPRGDWPDVSPLPEGAPLFGCFAEPSRIGDVSLELWRRILDRVPGSRLLLKHKTYEYPDQARYWRERFSILGNRLEMEGVPGSWAANMESVYRRVSVVLDSFPLTGATSSLIPLWMGAPVVTLAGHHSGQRYGVSMLTNAGVPELIAVDHDGYVELAAGLAEDRGRLKRYRECLRNTVRSSPIVDSTAVTRAIEDEYRRMWRQWCGSVNEAEHGLETGI
ncbi:hypothetical protein A6A04_12135 [Paramagnetospirillum marisnigri]|uniref:protein O-GlcNAc transferase n=1 Tax=Paramagnetospirillum marisnigri TaxID=1285242 RepID=A0A178MVU5_9PROT|nr:tetratricopeptide repeat protein [Paramagnetospirillum marisnigri]OAN54667.1 hypothetical protein A6A04_12135 [Paramagnetospirillum marisnigri]